MSVDVFSIPDVHAEVLVAEGRPVVVLIRSVPPLLVVGFFNSSQDDLGSSVVMALLDCQSP